MTRTPIDGKRTAIVAGKGELAVSIAEWFAHSSEYKLVAICPVEPAPKWTSDFGSYRFSHRIDHQQLLVGGADVLFSCFYDKIVPAETLARFGLALNLHPAPLPRYRGVKPINWALLNEETEHGVTIHAMDAGVDSGPIYGRATFPIWPRVDEVRDVYERTLRHAWELFLDVMPVVHDVEPTPQVGSLSTIHYSREDHMLGERSGWTKRESR